MREKWQTESAYAQVMIEESKIIAFHKKKEEIYSYRVHRDGLVGIHYQMGRIDDEEGFAKAQKNLERKRPYPFAPESGKWHRDMSEKKLTDKELMETARECLDGLVKTYPAYRFQGSFSQNDWRAHWESEAGIDYTEADSRTGVDISFKHRDSKDLCDGTFQFNMRTFDKTVFFRMAEDYLANFDKIMALPEEIVVDMQYYGLIGILSNSLDAENLALGTSLLTGKVGQKVFSEDFSLIDDVSSEEAWFSCFWDGDGCIREDGKLTLIDKGVIVTGYADKKNAAKYGVPHTRSAYHQYADIPGAGCRNLRITRSQKTVKELLDGRLAVVPVMMEGGGFNDKGEYTMPVHSALLYDGERVLGKLPPFTLVSSMYDMFGKDFIGVGADNPLFHDKQILFRAQASRIL